MLWFAFYLSSFYVNQNLSILQALLIRIMLSVIILIDIFCTKKGGFFFFNYIYVL